MSKAPKFPTSSRVPKGVPLKKLPTSVKAPSMTGMKAKAPPKLPASIEKTAHQMFRRGGRVIGGRK